MDQRQPRLWAIAGMMGRGTVTTACSPGGRWRFGATVERGWGLRLPGLAGGWGSDIRHRLR